MKPKECNELKFKKGEKVWVLKNMGTLWTVALMRIMQVKRGRGEETKNRYKMAGFGFYSFIKEEHVFKYDDKESALEKALELTGAK